MVSGLDVYPVELIVGGELITFALESFNDAHFFTQQHGEESS